MTRSNGASRSALVTGASRGIGRAVAAGLARQGWNVAFTFRSNREAAEETASLLEREGARCLSMRADARSYDKARHVVERARKAFGPLDLLVNNAGIRRDKALFRMRPEDWRDVIEVNLGGAFNYCRCAVPAMMKRGAGNIVNIVSVSGLAGAAGQANYSASKAGMIGLTKALAREAARFGVRVNAVAPGLVETDMTEGLAEKARRRLLEQVPLGAAGTPEQVAAAVLFLAGPESSYITGQVLAVDGGIL